MRHILARFEGTRRPYQAQIGRFGYETGRHGTRTCLLQHVVDVGTGLEVADHLWIKVTLPLRRGGWFDPGDRIQLSGVALRYFHGRKGEPRVMDYRLALVQDVKLIARAQKSEQEAS